MVIQNLHILNRKFSANMLLTLLAEQIIFCGKNEILSHSIRTVFTEGFYRFFSENIQRSDEFFHVHRDFWKDPFRWTYSLFH
jgi:hypothetical protein